MQPPGEQLRVKLDACQVGGATWGWALVKVMPETRAGRILESCMIKYMQLWTVKMEDGSNNIQEQEKGVIYGVDEASKIRRGSGQGKVYRGHGGSWRTEPLSTWCSTCTCRSSFFARFRGFPVI